ncbi:hypothetical protein X792_04750 [Dehalococcoides mccartyi CG1]|jgi:hypothetical protein|nr:hypothetical protein X792_04750 [Dehalococcoides mccartyi CG1]
MNDIKKLIQNIKSGTLAHPNASDNTYPDGDT